MKILNLGRGQGKTTRLLYASEWQGVPILCKDNTSKQHLLDMAQELGLQIPEPISASELTCETFQLKDINDSNIFVDEAHLVLQRILKSIGFKGNVKAITLSECETI